MGHVATADVCSLGVIDLARLYRRGQISPVEVTRATLDRIDRLNPILNAFITVLPKSAMAAAQAAEAELRTGIDLGPMHGIPVSVKDIIRVKGTHTSAASRVLDGEPPDAEDATVVTRLRAAGAIVLGKVNLSEFAFGDPDPNGPFGLVQNPRKLGYQCGGSSSGSACAAAAGLGVISIGSDTAGSIRHPASVCGIAGLKPTYGLVPVKGVIPLSTDLDHVGPLGRSVADCAAALSAIAGFDPDDPYSLREHGSDYMRTLDSEVRGLRIGIPTNAVFRFGEAEAITLVDEVRNVLITEFGLTPVEFALDQVSEVADSVRTTLIPVELWAYHARFRDRGSLYGSSFRDRASAGLRISAVDYLAAKKQQAALRREWSRLFDDIDVMLMPSNVGGTICHGETMAVIDGKAYPLRTVTAPFNPLANATGFPALVVPVGLNARGLPIAIQLIGPPLSERRLLAVGYRLEQAFGRLNAGWGIEPRE